MNAGRLLIRRALFLMAILVPAAIAAPPAAAQATDVLVFAAASLKTALDDIAQRWQRETGKKASVSYAGSSALARQIEQGAPADIFISADLDWMDYLQQRNLVLRETRINLLSNRLVLVAPAAKAAAITIAPDFPLADLLGGGRLAMALTEAVPAGRYGKAALEALGVWPSVARQVAQAENVRAALMLVARGEAPLGIVYQTDAAAEPLVRVAGTFPESSHPPIVYPAALTVRARRPHADAWMAALSAPAARAVFEQQGFTVLDR
jgi:molybdate transport system substrate-binding protein